MNNNNKILTVSYGTFSCTLEGFDDSFDTMKAIAEYFRDLAADDRYFGAEPPQPDADMLARIAQREVSRRVEAHEHDGRIMLKAHQDTVVPAAVAAVEKEAEQEEAAVSEPSSPLEEPTAEIQQEASAEQDTHVDAAAEDEAQAVPAVEEAEPLVAPAPEVSIEEETVTHDETYETQQAELEPEVDQVEETASEDVADPTDEEQIEAAAPEELITSEAQDEDEEPEVQLADIDAETDEGVEAVVEDSFHATEESIFAEDAPIEEEPLEISNLAHEDATDTPETSTQDEKSDIEDVAAFFADSELAHQPDMGTEEEISETGFAATVSEAEDIADAVEEFEVENVETSHSSFDNESLAEKLQRIRAVVSERTEDTQTAEYVEDIEEPTIGEGFDAFQELTAETSADDTESEESREDVPNDVIAEAAQDISDAFEADDAFVEGQDVAEASGEDDELDALLRRIEEQDDASEDVQALDLSAEIDEDEEPAENLFAASDEDEDEDATDVHGRVLKVNRADLEAALEAGDLQEYEEETLGTSAFAEEDELILSDELEVSDDAVEDAPMAAAPSSARESLPNIDSDSGEDVSRLMAEADHQMQEPEGKTRRSAFAHLRAAVAARFADRSMDETDKTVEEAAEAYRSDLAEVVKPRRPIAKTRSERPTDTRPAPLKLVAEQRIDPDAGPQRGPVAPRRVAAADDHDMDLAEDTGFAAYAEERGAESLPELLEAAAAYLAFVEGHEQFSRPQLMSRVRQANGGEFTREDGLRAFGQLLRTGKIEKIRGGRFAASDAISFKPDHRAAG